MEETRYSIAVIETVALIIRNNDQLLVVKSRGCDKWFMPGGKIDDGELPKQALIREIKEELAITLLPETICYQFSVSAAAYGQPDGVLVYMQCFTADYEGKPVASCEIEAIRYVGMQDSALLPPAGQRIMKRVMQEQDV